MEIEIFVISFGIFLALLFGWSFNALPKEKWQIIGAIPVNKTPQGDWNGINFTYYGFFNASACTLATAIFLLLLSTIDIPLKIAIVFFIILMTICLPAARIIAYLVERKRYTFSIGGASFVGMIVAPWLIVILRTLFRSWADFGNPVIAVLAAISIAYAFGEGIGRLACISFGCCYGKPLSSTHPLLQKIFKHCNFVFRGKTRKIVYADGFDGVKVIPVQALTAVLYCGAGLISLYIFLKSYYAAAFLVSMLVTQIWRFASEFLRADYRGQSRISKYQLMALLTIVYSLMIALLLPAATVPLPSVGDGLNGLWQPLPIILLQLFWVVVFVYTGKSDVTGSQISFHVIRDRI
jgi:hypothetical protein